MLGGYAASRRKAYIPLQSSLRFRDEIDKFESCPTRFEPEDADVFPTRNEPEESWKR